MESTSDLRENSFQRTVGQKPVWGDLKIGKSKFFSSAVKGEVSQEVEGIFAWFWVPNENG